MTSEINEKVRHSGKLWQQNKNYAISQAYLQLATSLSQQSFCHQPQQ